ncbi:MAG: YesL family protein [Chloroflexi bacterium]|nr:YesL family protein [Chloroflexota bacterium]
MKNVFNVFWAAVQDWWYDLFLLMGMNIVTVLLILPVVTFPPALAGLWNVGNLLAHGKAAKWADYFEGFRRYFWKAWGLALLNILASVILYVNIRFYAPDIVPFEISDTWSALIRGFFVATGLLWFIFQIYPMAALLEQEDQRLRVAFRNSAVIFATNPSFTFVLALLLLLVVAASTFFVIPWVVTLALVAVVCNKAALHLLKPDRERMRVEKEEKASSPDES